MPAQPFILPISDLDESHRSSVGGLPLTLSHLHSLHFPVASGFVISSDAFAYFSHYNQLSQSISSLLDSRAQQSTPFHLHKYISRLFSQAVFPEDLALKLVKAHNYWIKNRYLALISTSSRSSSVTLSAPTITRGDANFITAVSNSWLQFTQNSLAVSAQTPLHPSISVLAVDPPDVSGTLHTIDPVTGNKNLLSIEAAWGFSQPIFTGKITPDHYLINKSTLKPHHSHSYSQTIAYVAGLNHLKQVNLPPSKRLAPKLLPADLATLTKLGQNLQKHSFYPQHALWHKRRQDFIFLASTTYHQTTKVSATAIPTIQQPLLRGIPVAPGYTSGQASVRSSTNLLSHISSPTILVTKTLSPDIIPLVSRCSGIIAETGSQSSLAAQAARHFEKPCLTGCFNATTLIETGQSLRLNADLGEVFLSHQSQHLILPRKPQSSPRRSHKSATKLFVFLTDKRPALTLGRGSLDGTLYSPNRTILSLGVHPQKLIASGKSQLISDQITTDLTAIADSFAGRPLVYQLSDLAPSHYQTLKHSHHYEPNGTDQLQPKGLSRHLLNPQLMDLELQTLSNFKRHFYTPNLALALPFVRTPAEFKIAKTRLIHHHLQRSFNFQLWLNLDLPVNLFQLEEYINLGLDYFNLGIDSLTMLTLGVDPNDSDHDTNQQNTRPFTTWIHQLAKLTKKNHLASALTSSHLTRYPHLIKAAVDSGITTTITNPESTDALRHELQISEHQLITTRTK